MNTKGKTITVLKHLSFSSSLPEYNIQNSITDVATAIPTKHLSDNSTLLEAAFLVLYL